MHTKITALFLTLFLSLPASAGFVNSDVDVLYHSGKLTGQTDPVPRAHFCDPICAG